MMKVISSIQLAILSLAMLRSAMGAANGENEHDRFWANNFENLRIHGDYCYAQFREWTNIRNCVRSKHNIPFAWDEDDTKKLFDRKATLVFRKRKGDNSELAFAENKDIFIEKLKLIPALEQEIAKLHEKLELPCDEELFPPLDVTDVKYVSNHGGVYSAQECATAKVSSGWDENILTLQMEGEEPKEFDLLLIPRPSVTHGKQSSSFVFQILGDKNSLINGYPSATLIQFRMQSGAETSQFSDKAMISDVESYDQTTFDFVIKTIEDVVAKNKKTLRHRSKRPLKRSFPRPNDAAYPKNLNTAHQDDMQFPVQELKYYSCSEGKSKIVNVSRTTLIVNPTNKNIAFFNPADQTRYFVDLRKLPNPKSEQVGDGMRFAVRRMNKACTTLLEFTSKKAPIALCQQLITLSDGDAQPIPLEEFDSMISHIEEEAAKAKETTSVRNLQNSDLKPKTELVGKPVNNTNWSVGDEKQDMQLPTDSDSSESEGSEPDDDDIVQLIRQDAIRDAHAWKVSNVELISNQHGPVKHTFDTASIYLHESILMIITDNETFSFDLVKEKMPLPTVEPMGLLVGLFNVTFRRMPTKFYPSRKQQVDTTQLKFSIADASRISKIMSTCTELNLHNANGLWRKSFDKSIKSITEDVKRAVDKPSDI